MKEILLINKEPEWTSFDVVAKIRGFYSQKAGKKIKVGHAGTLDPFATGLLIVLVGDATKAQDEYMKLDKEYEATLKLGYNSTTGDPEGEISSLDSARDLRQIPNEVQISECLNKFTGDIVQTPPQYSAIKIDGKPAYKYAREGKKVDIKPRNVLIHDIEVEQYNYPVLKIKVKCSSGTYIRTLAEDIGKELGSGAYLTDLRRTKIGKNDIKDAKKVDIIIKKEEL